MNIKTYLIKRLEKIELERVNLSKEHDLITTFLDKQSPNYKSRTDFPYTPGNLRLFIKMSNTTRQNLGAVMGYSSGQKLSFAIKHPLDENYQAIPTERWQKLLDSRYGTIVLNKLKDKQHLIEVK